MNRKSHLHFTALAGLAWSQLVTLEASAQAPAQPAPDAVQTAPAAVAAQPAAAPVDATATAQTAQPVAGDTAVAPATVEAPAVETPAVANDAPVDATVADEKKPEPFKGFKVQAEDGAYQLRVGGYVQADGRFFTKAKGSPTDTFAVRRARIELRGTLAKYFDILVQPELAESKLTLLDAYGNIHLIDEVQLQVGKMKSPVGLEYLQSPTDLIFPEFGLPSLLVPQRDVGFNVHGDIAKGGVTYQLGVFNGVADGTNGDLDENSGKDLEYRLFVRPFKLAEVKPLEGFGIGLAGTAGKQVGVLPGFKTAGRETFFSYAATASAVGHRTRWSPQVNYYNGPVGVFGEYVRSQQTVSDGVATGKIANAAWQLAGSFVLGGKAGYKGAEPDAPLDPKANSWGALELGLRYGQIAFEQQAFDYGFADPTSAVKKASSFGVAASWWFLKGTRAQLSYDTTAFEGGAAAGGDRESEGVVVTRLQVSL
jgi:phosphate-selective porin OprO/OprP